MPNNGTTSLPLKDLLVATKDGDWGKDEAQEGHIPYRVIRGADFPDARLGLISTIPRCYLAAKTVVRRTLQPNDILIETAGGNRDRPTGRTLLVTQRLLKSLDLPATCASFCRFLRVDPEKAVPGYVFWYLQYLYYLGEMWKHQVQHTGVARFQYTKFAESERIPLPAKQEQIAIADTLSSLDDKLDLNRQMNVTLEKLARAVFRSWFVDFDPVRAKVDGRQPDGLDAATVCLFPKKFEDSPLGPVPQGWPVVSLGDYVEVAKGLSYKGEGLSEAGMALHNLNSVYEGGGYKHEGIKHYVGEYRPCHVIRAGDVIVANTEQGHNHLLIGYSALIPKRYGDLGLFTHHTYRVRPLPESPLTPPFIHHLLLTHRFRGEVIGYTNGTTVNMLPADGLKRPRLVLPPAELIRRFTDFVTPLIDRAEANEEESRTLTVTRDALLPKLLSGEVEVK